jgi:hypothetical protein
LIRKGFDAEVAAIIRIIFEALFVLKCCCDDKDFVREFIKTDEKRRFKIMQIAQQYSYKPFLSVKDYATKEVISDLKEKIDKESIKDLITEQIAQKSGLKNYYDSIYRLFSDSIHTSPISLERFADANDTGDITHIVHAPRDKDAEFYLITLVDLILKTLECVLNLFRIDKEDIIKDFVQRFNILNKET